MNDLKKVLIGIMDVVHELCTNNDINYTLCGGSMIGAVRHNGIIPWDDDIDIFMTMDNYAKFISVVKDLKHEFVDFQIPLQTSTYQYGFIKAVDRRTTIVEEYFNNASLALGVYVDIFPIVGVNRNFNVKKQIRKKRLLTSLLALKATRDASSLKRKIALIPAMLISSRRLVKYYINKFIDADVPNSKFVHDPEGYSPNKVVPREWFNEYILMPFEGREYYVIKEYDKYLTQIFGNYMELPPEDKRHSHDRSYLNLEKPYKEYIAENTKQ